MSSRTIGLDYLIADRCQQPLAPGDSCQVGVRFSPQAQGPRSATLTIPTNASGPPSSLTLSGRGIAPLGTIVRRNTGVAVALCTLEFAPGTFTIQGQTKQASFRIMRRGRVVVAGILPVTHATVSRTTLGRLGRGRYTVIITTGHGHGRRVLLTEVFQLS